MNQLSTRLLRTDEAIPYELLLLADETKEIVDGYIHTCAIYVLEDCGKIIAQYALLPINDNTIEVKNIAVDTAFQGKGIGKQLLKNAIKNARTRGYNKLIIGTGDASFKQLYLYQKAGFDIVDIKRNFFINHYSEPIFENGIQLKHMIMLQKEL